MHLQGWAKARAVLFGLFLGFYASSAVAFGKPVPEPRAPLFDASGNSSGTSRIADPFYPQNLWLLQSGALHRLDADNGNLLEQRIATNADALALQPSDGTAWFADNMGINAVTLDGERMLDVSIPLPGDEKVSGLTVDDANGLLWAATDSGLHRLSVTGQYLSFLPLENIAAPPAWMRDRGDVWLLADGEIQRVSAGGEWLGRITVPGVNEVRALMPTQDGRSAWIADRENIVGMNSDGSLLAGPWAHGLAHPTLVDGDGSGGVWLTDGQEIVHLNAAGNVALRSRPVKDGLLARGASGTIRALNADRRDGSVWIALNHSAHKLAANGALVSSVALEKRGGAVMASALHIDDTRPEIWISEPKPEIYTNDNTPPMSVAYADYGSRIVVDSLGFTLNEKAVTVSCDKNETSADCTPLAPFEDGYHTLAATIEDLAHNVSEPDSLRFTVDTVAPTITVRAPGENLYTNQPLLEIEGSLDEFAYLHLNDNSLPIDANFAFTTEQLLDEGENTFRFRAEDRATNASELTRTAVLDSTPPVLTIHSPQSGYSSTSDRITVEGGVNEASKVTIDGIDAVLDRDGKFTLEMTLSEGLNRISVVAEDRAGNRSSATLDVTFDITPPTAPDVQMISISEPDEDGNVTISGLPGSVEPGSTIVISIVTDASGRRMMVPGALPGANVYHVVAGADGSFVMIVPLDPLSEMEIVIIDQAGNASEAMPVNVRDTIERSNTLVGGLSGEFSVDQSGAANFRIPIALPKGAAGVQPDLALLYSSRAGDGQLGVGWSLSGLSTISRCPKNVAMDGVFGTVSYSRSDRFCLDGQRLIQSSGSYGGNGTQYYTEVASFQRITSKGGNVDDGPEYFVVEDKAGLKRYYGAVPNAPDGPDGRVPLSGDPTARSWAVSRIEDRLGNHIDFYYAMASANRESYLDRIDWFNVDDVLLGRADFTFEKIRDHNLTGYIRGGSQTAQTLLLTEIRITARGYKTETNQTVGEYNLSYESDRVTQRKQLTSVQYCVGDQCLAPTVMRYTERNLVFSGEAILGSYPSGSVRHIDLDRDGRSDSIWQRDSRLWLRLRGGGSRDTGIPLTSGAAAFYTFMDYNGDGYLDLVKPSDSAHRATWSIHRWVKSQRTWEVTPVETFIASVGESEQIPIAVDWDGDGRQEIIATNTDYLTPDPILVLYDFDTIVDLANKFHYTVMPKQRIHVVEFNGDGRPDLFVESEGCSSASTNSFSIQLLEPTFPDEGAGGGGSGGDDADDDTDPPPIEFPTNKSCAVSAGVLLNNGTKLVEPADAEPATLASAGLIQPTMIPYCPPEDPDPAPICELPPIGGGDGGGDDGDDTKGGNFAPSDVKAVDVNNDGLTDMVRYVDAGNFWTLTLNNGRGWQDVWTGASGDLSTSEFDKTTVTDVNNDGLADLVLVNADKARLFYGRGNSFVDSGITLPYRSDGYQLQDVNTDGLIDVVYMRGDEWKVRYGEGPIPGLLTQFSDGYGAQTEVLYAALAAGYVNGNRVYRGHITSASDIDSATGDRQQDFMGPLPVVTLYATDTGADDPIFTRYRYWGARVDADGRGFLGFREVAAYNENTGIQTVNVHRQAFPYIGMVEESRQLIPDQPLVTVDEQAREEASNDPCVKKPWICQEADQFDEPVMGKVSAMTKATDYNGLLLFHTVNETQYIDYTTDDRYQAQGIFPFVEKSSSKTYDYNGGEHLKTETITTKFEDFGNVDSIRSVTAGAGEVHSIYTDNTYGVEDLPKMCLGRVTDVRVEHTWSGATDSGTETRESQFIYDMGGNCQLTDEIVEPNGGPLQRIATHYEHDRFGNITVQTVAGFDGYQDVTRTTTTEYDLTGRFPKRVVNAAGHDEHYTWDARFGVKTSSTGPNGVGTRWEYDAIGRITSAKTGIVDGVPTRVTTVARAWCENAPCGIGNGQYRVIESSNDGTRTTTVHDRLQRPIAIDSLDMGGKVLAARKVYDLRGRVMAESIPMYSNAGLRCWVYIEYDNLDREVARYSPATSSACSNESLPTLASVQAFIANPPAGYLVNRVVYDGFTTFMQAANGRVQSRTTHVNGWLKELAERSGRYPISPESLPDYASQAGVILATRYFYDAQGNLERVSDPAGNTVTMSYDNRGRKNSMDDPDMGHWEYAHNAFGELTAQTDAMSQVVTMRYDALGRQVERIEPEGITRWEYDTAEHGLGQLARVTAPDGYTEVHAYDAHVRPTSSLKVLDGRLFQTRTTYDSLGRVSSTHYPALSAPSVDPDEDLDSLASVQTAGLVANYHYDRGRLERVTDGNGAPIWTVTKLDTAARVQEVQFGNGLREQRFFDLVRGTLTGTNVRRGIADFLLLQSYQWDAVGNLTARTHNLLGITETFTYDVLDRLDVASLAFANSEVLDEPVQTRHVYDPIGNLKTIGSSAIGYAYGKLDEGVLRKPHAVSRAIVDGGMQTYEYDDNGNQISAGSREIAWTSYNKPREISDGENASTFAYGPDRARYRHVREDENGLSTTTYVGSLYERIERPGKDTLHRFNIRAGSQVIAVKEVITTSDDTVRSFITNYLHRDHLGSVVLITDNNGETVEQPAYDAWGRRRDLALMAALVGSKSKTAASAVSMLGAAYEPAWDLFHRGFTGHEQLDHLNLVHMNGRVYDPSIGRFLSADPFVQFPESTQGYNRYTYVANNPLSYTDPSGYNLLDEIGDVISADAVRIAVGVLFAASTAGTSYWAVGGFMSGFATSGGNVRAGFFAMASAAVFHAIGTSFEGVNTSFGSPGYFAKVLAHGVAGGALSSAGGGRFGDGFLGSASAQAFSPAIESIPGVDGGGRLARIVIASVIGGTAAEIGGGKFSNGAITAAFGQAFNDLSHLERDIEKLPEAYREALRKGIIRGANDAMKKYREYYEADPKLFATLIRAGNVPPEQIDLYFRDVQMQLRALMVEQSASFLVESWVGSSDDLAASAIQEGIPGQAGHMATALDVGWSIGTWLFGPSVPDIGVTCHANSPCMWYFQSEWE